MVRARGPTMRWLVMVAALVVGPAANSEPIHLACEGAMRANEPRHERLDEKYLMSLVIDLSARTVKPEGHPSVPLKESIDDEDVVAFASPRASDDILDGRLNRITGEALIHFLTDPMYEFHGRCHRAESLFESPHARWGAAYLLPHSTFVIQKMRERVCVSSEHTFGLHCGLSANAKSFKQRLLLVDDAPDCGDAFNKRNQFRSFPRHGPSLGCFLLRE
jgi:hypothetical protein